MSESIQSLIGQSKSKLQSKDNIKYIEEEWGKYKYLVLEYSPAHYQAIRQVLKDKSAYPYEEFCDLLAQSFAHAPRPNVRLNAYDHVWGHFKNLATEEESQHYQDLIHRWQVGDGPRFAIKQFLHQLAKTYKDSYLLDSYFFLLV